MMSRTAIVSPRARPRPSIEAEITPGRPKGSTAVRIISQRVAPRASARLLVRGGRLGEDLAAEARDDGQDHDGEDRPTPAKIEPGSRRCRREQRDPAEHLREPVLDRRRGTVQHDVRAPEAVDDRRHGGEQVDGGGERPRQPRRRVLREEQGDADGDRHRDDHRDHRRDDGHPQQVGDAELRRVAAGVPDPAVRKFAVVAASEGTAWTSRKTADRGDEHDDEGAGADGQPARRCGRPAGRSQPARSPDGCGVDLGRPVMVLMRVPVGRGRDRRATDAVRRAPAGRRDATVPVIR